MRAKPETRRCAGLGMPSGLRFSGTSREGYLLFIRRLDDLNTLAEKKAHRTGRSEGIIIFGPD
jgi:hypothetical protein